MDKLKSELVELAIGSRSLRRAVAVNSCVSWAIAAVLLAVQVSYVAEMHTLQKRNSLTIQQISTMAHANAFAISETVQRVRATELAVENLSRSNLAEQN